MPTRDGLSKVEQTYQKHNNSPKTEEDDRGTTGSGNIDPSPEIIYRGKGTTHIESGDTLSNTKGEGVSRQELHPQSKLEKFINWFLGKWDKYRNL